MVFVPFLIAEELKNWPSSTGRDEAFGRESSDVHDEEYTYRPDPIGLTLVRLIEVEDNVLTVQGLDAFDETRVLDIKPFDN